MLEAGEGHVQGDKTRLRVPEQFSDDHIDKRELFLLKKSLL